LLSSEGNLINEKEKLEAQKRMTGEEAKQLHDLMEKQAENWQHEKRDLQAKIQDLLLHNEKVKDDCLKKVVAYKDKYADYKNKVKLANSQIATLTQRIAKYEMEK
jgi:predicted  nucleic acid-binding Zn-ribbon protein